MIQPENSILELCHVVRDVDSAILHWTNVIGAGPFYVFDIPAMPGQMNRGAPSAIDLRIGMSPRQQRRCRHRNGRAGESNANWNSHFFLPISDARARRRLRGMRSRIPDCTGFAAS